MKKTIFFLLLILNLFKVKSQTPSLTLLNTYSLTPNTTDSIGAFARIYYHAPRNKFYSIYAARPANSAAPSGQLSNFAWREYDASMNFTGIKGTLSGQSGAGDFACVMVDSTYYHLTALGSTTSGILKYKLTKYDDDFVSIASQTITLSNHDSNIDQLLNYTNGKLIIGAMLDSSATPPITPPLPTYNPNIHIYQYDLNLNSIATDKVLTPKAYSWGASCIFNAGNYYILTTNSISTHSLYCYKFDPSFNYISTTQISSDGQWSQGVLFYGGYYYLAHHTGDHNRGNVAIEIYNTSWAPVYSTTVTNYVVPTTTGSISYNANRPFLQIVGTKLYVSYDVEKYILPVNQKDWQARVNVFQINGITGMKENETYGSVLIYPNPINGVFTVKTSPISVKEKISFYNMLGDLIYETTFTNEISINSKNWEKGVYFYETKNQSAKGKIIIN